MLANGFLIQGLMDQVVCNFVGTVLSCVLFAFSSECVIVSEPVDNVAMGIRLKAFVS